MTTMAEDIVEALINLGGQAPLKAIYAEVGRIRTAPLPKNLSASIRGTIEDHSPDSTRFKGRDLFRKVSRGVWALSNQSGLKAPSPVKKVRKKSRIRDVEITESYDTIANLLTTIKEYRDFSKPDETSWAEYIQEFFHLMGFSTKELGGGFFTLGEIGSRSTPKAVAVITTLDNDFEEIGPGVTWEFIMSISVKSLQVDWGILIDGYRLKVFDCRKKEPKVTLFLSSLDEIVRNCRIEDFYTIYKMFAIIKGNAGELRKRKSGIREGVKRPERFSRRMEFWKMLLAKAKLHTKIHENISHGTGNWVSAGAGKTGLSYSYVVRMNDAQVELYIDRGDAKWNNQVFNFFYHRKDEIEDVFGDNLEWQALEDKRSCRIRYLIPEYGLRNNDQWPELQDSLIDAMIRLHKALDPMIKQLD
jgi:hypothetical protein